MADTQSPDPSPSNPQYNRTQYFLILIVVFLYWAGLYLYVPTLPVYVQTKTELLEMVGVVIAMYGLWQAICGCRWGFCLIGLGGASHSS